MKRKSAITVVELGIGLIVITFIILASAPIISHNNQQKRQTQAEYMESLNNNAEKSAVAKLKQQTFDNAQRLNDFNTRLTGLEQYVRQYVGNTIAASNNVSSSNNNPLLNDGSYVCNITGYADENGNSVEPSPQEFVEFNKQVAEGTKKVIMTCGVYKR